MWGSWERTQLHFRLASTLPLHTGGWRSVSVSLSETRLMAFSFCVSVPAVFIRALGNNVKRLSELTDPRQLPAAEQEEEEDTLFTVGPSVKSIYLWLWLCAESVCHDEVKCCFLAGLFKLFFMRLNNKWKTVIMRHALTFVSEDDKWIMRFISSQYPGATIPCLCSPQKKKEEKKKKLSFEFRLYTCKKSMRRFLSINYLNYPWPTCILYICNEIIAYG